MTYKTPVCSIYTIYTQYNPFNYADVWVDLEFHHFITTSQGHCTYVDVSALCISRGQRICNKMRLWHCSSVWRYRESGFLSGLCFVQSSYDRLGQRVCLRYSAVPFGGILALKLWKIRAGYLIVSNAHLVVLFSDWLQFILDKLSIETKLLS